jgi:hypothetical protein
MSASFNKVVAAFILFVKDKFNEKNDLEKELLDL